MKTEYRSRTLCWDLVWILTAKRSLKGFQACRGRFPSPSLCHLGDVPSTNIKKPPEQCNKINCLTSQGLIDGINSLVLFFTLCTVTIYSAIYLTCAHMLRVSSRAWILPYITETSQEVQQTASQHFTSLISDRFHSFGAKQATGEFGVPSWHSTDWIAHAAALNSEHPSWEDMNRKERDTNSG